MSDNQVRKLWDGLNGAIYSVERDRILNEPADDGLIVSLAQRVIREIDALPDLSKEMCKRRNDAEAIVYTYSPLAPSLGSAPEYSGLDVLQRA